MPLHLLGKKSWNVYNAANIERVRRDEAVAAAAEAAEEQRMQEIDAARRLAILRGEEPPPLPAPSPPDASAKPDREPRGFADDVSGGHRERRKRKRAGEDDTDFEMRVARERVEAGSEAARRLGVGDAKREREEVRIVDERGHISLFESPADERTGRDATGARAGRERRDLDRDQAPDRDVAAMRFSDAAGRGDPALAKGSRPWYARSGEAGGGLDFEPTSKDVWGNEDPGRKVRQAARMDANDPLVMMKRGAAKVRELGKERKREMEERERELRQLRREERRRERRRRREGREGRGDRDDVDDLEGFSLDDPRPARTEKRRHCSSHHREGRHRYERDRSSGRERASSSKYDRG